MNKDQIILDNQALIYSLAKRFNSADREDLIQEGNLGFTKAVNNYKDGYNTKVTTYSRNYIFGEMCKYTRNNKGIKVSRDIQNLNSKIEKANNLLSQKLMRKPTIDELSDFLEIPSYLIAEALNSNQVIYSLDEPISEDGKELTLQDKIAIVENMSLDDLILLREELSKLSLIEQEIINKRYMNDMTQQQTAQALDMSQVQVSRYEQKILSKLRNRMVA